MEWLLSSKKNTHTKFSKNLPLTLVKHNNDQLFNAKNIMSYPNLMVLLDTFERQFFSVN